MNYFYIVNHELKETKRPTKGMAPFIIGAQSLLPPMIGKLHQNFHAWGALGLSPGPIQPNRIWFDEMGILIFQFKENAHPAPLMHTGFAPYLAAWLVLLNRWMETYVVIARARAIWSPAALASALSFTTPAFLPAEVLHGPEPAISNHWVEVAHALATAVVDGPLSGVPDESHWGQ